jgi:hypothetical protein
MATLGQVGELATTQLRERLDRLVAAVEDDATDFAEVARRADEVGDLAVVVGEIYREVEQILLSGLLRFDGSNPEDDRSQREQAGRGAERRQSEQSDATAENVTKAELLEQARDLNVEGRSSMSKEELAQAVEAEESQTKEELLERARQAGVEGRSSMTKDELRKAVHEASVSGE